LSSKKRFHKTLATVLAAAVANAQTSRGTVTGTVLDPSGAPVPGAALNLTATSTGVLVSTRSNSAGMYRFDAVDPGAYSLAVQHPGFKTFLANGIAVESNRTATIDPRLEVGDAGARIEVSAESSGLLTRDGPLRGGNFLTRDAQDLPLLALNPLSLVRTLPGATEAFGSTVWSSGYGTPGGESTAANTNGAGLSINGQRPRGNNYLLDGVDNNEVWLGGEELVFMISDAVEEVSAQTADFGVEFGRAGGGVFNVITKAGTNKLKGSLVWRYQSERFESVSNYDRLNGIPKSVVSSNVFGFTAGGPIHRYKTFFFAGLEQNNTHSTANYPLQVPTAAAVTQLEALFPANPRLSLYLNALGMLRGTANPFSLGLGIDPASGADRGSIQFATAAYVLPALNDGPQWLGRIDHVASDRHRLSWRYIYDSRVVTPSTVTFPGYVSENEFSHHNFLFSDSYTFSPTFTNEFRFAYARPDADLGQQIAIPGTVPLPQFLITNISAPGSTSESANFHYGNNFVFQETQTKVISHHAFRYGIDLLKETVTEQRGGGALGSISFNNSVGYSAFANFLDDFSGPSGGIARTFAAPVIHPNQFHQGYFFQDNWKVTPSLSLTIGLRYDNFGNYYNSIAYPAFSGFNSSQFLVRHTVSPDNTDFGPSFGLAWSPQSGSPLGRVFGMGGKTIWRGGYQISYDFLPTQLILLGPADSSPNAILTQITAPNAGRGVANWIEQMPMQANAPSLLDSENPLAANLRNPYTERWSFGFQRELEPKMFLDVSYVGSESHRLTTRADWNPRLPTGTLRLYPAYGQVNAKTSEGNSSYHALQASLSRHFSKGIELLASYTWSKMIDSTSDGVGNTNGQDVANGNFTSVPVMYGGLALDRSVGDFDRPQRLTISTLWAIPGVRKGPLRYSLGGWQFSGIAIFQSGTPFSIGDGFDRNNYGDKEDRADISNPNAPMNTRAILFPNCPTGYQNPDTGACVAPSSVHWVEGTGFPNASTVGRNTMRTSGMNNFDLSLTKSIAMGETRSLELRWEVLNALNHPQYLNVPSASIVGSLPGRFLNLSLTDGGIRSMWVQVKVRF
jgi:Carboxypeptidase regulatory-like domain/TonB dependent receptor